jgi:NAD(P)H-dependent FMN reductase
MLKLGVVIASTRPVRVGKPVGDWFFEVAKNHGKFDVSLIDLAEINLPLLDEPKHPRFQDYQHDHTKKWSAIVSPMDAFAFVTPEYDYGTPASLLNALQCLYKEWNYKAAVFVSYGGVSGGTRSVNASRITLTALKMVPLAEGVHIPFVAKSVQDGKFNPPEGLDASVGPVLDELLKWSEAIASLRG